ncbi:MAG: glycosyltransferase [Enterococcus lacertideformus]|uniref:Glycosyltransferase n=1 Tax=Enterococcus lacertideformus TaxID=2771493 RepID=A0A931AUW8_9ENTE|nr:glycosyltransferase [Enterococcus lacertideformus]
MVGYPVSLLFIAKGIKPMKSEATKRSSEDKPTVTILIVAHNEEQVILDKLKNVCALDYPNEKIEIIVASDHSTDRTNQIVEQFIQENPKRDIHLYPTQQRDGKTNAQNEAVRIAKNEIIVFTDTNAMIDPLAIEKLVDGLAQTDVCYVTGRLIYKNTQQQISQSESTYWDMDVRIRSIESQLQTITAGNGALYACWRADYIEVPVIESHDSALPRYFALQNKRALAIDDAFVYEKAGETKEDEFKRKVRMNRLILPAIMPDFRILNILKYKWYTFFYFGHRTCRYTLWLNHLLLLASNFLLLPTGIFYQVTFFGQLLFYLIGNIVLLKNSKNKYLSISAYYLLTIYAQLVGVYNSLTGKNKPYWDKAETTR